MMTDVALVACVLIVAWLTAGGMAVRSASRIWLRHWAERRLRGAASVLMYLERPQRLLASANAAQAIVLVVAGLLIGWRRASRQDIAVLDLGLYAIAVVFLGQILPRALARRWPSAFIPICMPLLQAAEQVTSPLLTLGRRIVERRAEPTPSEPHETMHDLLREGELEGVGRRDEIAIISGVMEFGEKAVRDVMTPRDSIFAIPEMADTRRVSVQIAESAFSRVPVYRGTLDQIIGMYHAFDVLKARAEQLPPLRPVAYASADAPCNELLFRMLRARLHLAVVHDERGHTLGIATLENLLEELVGDIRDEHDEPEAAVSPAVSRT